MRRAVQLGDYVFLADQRHKRRHYGQIRKMDDPEPGFTVMEEAGTRHCYAEPADSPVWTLTTREDVLSYVTSRI